MAHLRPTSSRGVAPRLATLLVVPFLLCAATSIAVAQGEEPQGTLRVGAGPYYANVPTKLQLVVSGLEGQPQPIVEHDPLPEGCSVTDANFGVQIFSGPRRDASGRVSQVTQCTWTIESFFTTASAGTVRTPAFTVRQGGRSVRIEGTSLTFGTIPVSDRIGVEVVLPERPIYPGQRIPIEVRMKLDSALDNEIVDYNLTVPFSALGQNFSFIDAPLENRRRSLEISTGAEVIVLDREGTRGNGPDGSETWLVARRTLVPLRAGVYELPASTLLAERGTRWRRVFGGREAIERELLLAKDIPRTITVKAIPPQGRPASFAGGVGRGFTLGVEANRSVVRTGDPIELTFTLRGDGNLQSASLPDLAAAGLPEGSFTYTRRAAAGIYHEETGTKLFRVTVTPTDASVNALPPLEYAWYDPDAEAYRTTRTEPIALAVEQGEVVGAEAVVGGPTRTDAADPAAIDPPVNPARNSAARPRYVLDGADLALVEDPARLAVVERDRFGGALVRHGMIALGVLLLLAAFGTRLRDRTPPETRARRTRLAELAKDAQRAAQDRSADGLRGVVGNLRTMMREVRRAGGDVPDGLEEFIRSVEDRIYAPDDRGSGSDDIVDRTRTLARALEEAGR